jgi:hypothetical protein
MAELSSDRIIDNILDSQLGSERDGEETASHAGKHMGDVAMEDEPTPGPRRVGFDPTSISKVVDQTALLVMESFEKFLERYNDVILERVWKGPVNFNGFFLAAIRRTFLLIWLANPDGMVYHI